MSCATRDFGASTLLATALLALAGAEAAAQSWRDVTLSRQLSGEEALSVAVRYGIGELRVRAAAADGPLYRMQLRYDEDAFQPLADYRPGRLRLGVESIGRSVLPGRGRNRSGGELALELAGGVPMDLELEFGAGRADLDLGRLALRQLVLRTGASETKVDVSSPNSVAMRSARLEVGAADFTALRLGNLNASEITVSAGVGKVRLEHTGEWRQHARVHVRMGLGSLELVFPEGLGVRLTPETFLTSLDPEGLVKRGNAYYSLDWEEAERRVDVTVNAAFGSVKVQWAR